MKISKRYDAKRGWVLSLKVTRQEVTDIIFDGGIALNKAYDLAVLCYAFGERAGLEAGRKIVRR